MLSFLPQYGCPTLFYFYYLYRSFIVNVIAVKVDLISISVNMTFGRMICSWWKFLHQNDLSLYGVRLKKCTKPVSLLLELSTVFPFFVLTYFLYMFLPKSVFLQKYFGDQFSFNFDFLFSMFLFPFALSFSLIIITFSCSYSSEKYTFYFILKQSFLH